MKKHIAAAAALLTLPLVASAQGATDGYNFSQTDLKGTARFMSMGGAFGALGGDLSTLSQNPAGIGVYRHSEIGFTVDLDCQRATSNSSGLTVGQNQTKFLLNNIGGVATWRLGSSAIPNFNLGFTYNKAASFNRRYRGSIGNLQTSMSNYVAGLANGSEYTVGDLTSTSDYNPYNPQDGGIAPGWLPILGYDSYLITPSGNPDYPVWDGQFGNGTSGSGTFDVTESGGVNEYNIALGGNINNIVFWGMDFGIINMNYSQSTMWSESLDNAYVNGEEIANSTWTLGNGYTASANGFNYKLGVIVKPIQELRLGFAFHTPTWYSVSESYQGRINFNDPSRDFAPASAITNNGNPGYNNYNFQTPWRFMFSAAGVIANRLILSADFEWEAFNTMNFSDQNPYVYDWGYDNGWGYDDWWSWYRPTAEGQGGAATRSPESFANTNQDIEQYYQTSYNLRIGAEFRVTDNFSVRAGYNYVSSPVRASARNNAETIYTVGTNPAYRFDNTTNYVTCGLGYKTGGFYVDLAYIYKHKEAEYHAFTPDPTSSIQSPSSKLSLNNNQIVLSMGFKF
ncbi:MAG: hypothetical protein HDS80_03025 [Bacteroidales bacterium]|nr:hypothetical protein [Bacteroidales bacterium]